MGRSKVPGGDRAAARSALRFANGLLWTLALTAVLIGSCRPQPTPQPAPVIEPTALPHGYEIRFGLIGEVTPANVWALFDKAGYSYSNYAVRSMYWPRLFGLSTERETFQPVAAAAMPSPVRAEGAFYTATVHLRDDLKWTDGRPFGAEDVAFTVNTALEFQLGFDWADYYPSKWLDHVEAVDTSTIKYVFRQAPDSGVWQYGVLLGPIAQNRFWAEQVASAAKLLPAADAEVDIAARRAKVVEVQGVLDRLYLEAVTATGESARQVQADIRRQQGNLDQATNDANKAQTAYDTALEAARSALYALDDAGEPHLGPWLPALSEAGAEKGLLVNQANPDWPGQSANFDLASYRTFASQLEALDAMKRGDIDVILDPARAPTPTSTSANVMTSPTRNVRMLVMNPASAQLQSKDLRAAVACMVDAAALVRTLGGEAEALNSFTGPSGSPWSDGSATLPCQGMDEAGRLAQAVALLKTSGYAWDHEPAMDSPGSGLTAPHRQRVREMELLAPADDPARVAAAKYVEQQARTLGIPVMARSVSPEAVDYAVFASREYDMAVLGWRLSRYPGYLCGWFGSGGPFHFDDSGAGPLCDQLQTTSDLGGTRTAFHKLEEVLSQEVPMVPLYADTVSEPYRGVSYPFRDILDGLAGAYGAPSEAIPALP